MPAVVLLCGPPWVPGGKTARSRRPAALGVGHQQRAPRPAQGLVRCRRDDVCVPDRRGMRATGDQPGDVGDVGNQQRVDLARDPGEPLEVDRPWDRAPAAEDEPRARAQRELADLVEVDNPGVGSHLVAHAVEPPPRQRDVPAMCEMSPIGRLIPMIVSPGSTNASRIARFAGEPEYAWTLACSTPNNVLVRSIARLSTSSIICWPS